MSHHFTGKTYDLTQANFQKVILELEAVTAAHEELLGSLPKIPMQPYEKQLTQRIVKLEECLREVIRNSHDIVAKKLCSRILHGEEAT